MEILNQEIEHGHKERRINKIDFKMVTFSLGGKDYGIDIMRVKEISKVDKYTYVPNTLPYVLGVHNLRGDIVSIIDMRKMFHLPVKKQEALLNVIILRFGDIKLGIVVDSIDKVIGISSASIQPPPPLFGDINIQYINGVVEYSNKLYIVLDVDKIFAEKEEESLETQVNKLINPAVAEKKVDPSLHEFNFIVETLATFKKFQVSELNIEWAQNRFKEWKAYKESRGENFQLKSEDDADEFLAPFYSNYTGKLFEEDYKQAMDIVLPDSMSGPVNIWNTGCAKGYESYSVTAIVRMKYPKGIIKTWANDNDLLSVSTGPSIYFKEHEIPEYLKNSDLLETTTNGYQFKKSIKDLIYFEFHDTLNKNAMPDIDIIVARDIISFQTTANQNKMVTEFVEKLKKGGIIIVGDNEVLNDESLSKIDITGITAYKKEV